MLKGIHKRMQGDKGFTLIELMVVVLIIGILLAIAIPTFLRVRRSAQDKAAQSSVQDAVKAEKAHYIDNSATGYTTLAADLETIEPSIDYFGTTDAGSCAGFAAGPKCVQVTVSNNGTFTNATVVLIALSQSGKYWAMKDVAAGTGAGTFFNNDGDDTAAAAADPTDGEW